MRLPMSEKMKAKNLREVPIMEKNMRANSVVNWMERMKLSKRHFLIYKTIIAKQK
jgi:hypothetical protein